MAVNCLGCLHRIYIALFSCTAVLALYGRRSDYPQLSSLQYSYAIYTLCLASIESTDCRDPGEKRQEGM